MLLTNAPYCKVLPYFYCIFDQINANLGRMRDQPQTFVIYIFRRKKINFGGGFWIFQSVISHDM